MVEYYAVFKSNDVGQQHGRLGGLNACLLNKNNKTINKQLQTDENSSEKDLDCNEEAVETLQGSKMEDGHMEKSRKYFTCVTHPPVQGSLALSGIPLEGFYPKGQGKAVETQQASLLWTFATEDPTVFTSTKPS